MGFAGIGVPPELAAGCVFLFGIERRSGMKRKYLLIAVVLLMTVCSVYAGAPSHRYDGGRHHHGRVYRSHHHSRHGYGHYRNDGVRLAAEIIRVTAAGLAVLPMGVPVQTVYAVPVEEKFFEEPVERRQSVAIVPGSNRVVIKEKEILIRRPVPAVRQVIYQW